MDHGAVEPSNLREALFSVGVTVGVATTLALLLTALVF